jgi:hypothetical protein
MAVVVLAIVLGVLSGALLVDAITADMIPGLIIASIIYGLIWIGGYQTLEKCHKWVERRRRNV